MYIEYFLLLSWSKIVTFDFWLLNCHLEVYNKVDRRFYSAGQFKIKGVNYKKYSTYIKVLSSINILSLWQLPTNLLRQYHMPFWKLPLSVYPFFIVEKLSLSVYPFFIVENKEIQVRREGVRAKFPYFCLNFKWCPSMFFKQTFP